MNNKDKFYKIINKYNLPTPVSYNLIEGKIVKTAISRSEMNYIVFDDNTCLCIDSSSGFDGDSEVEFIEPEDVYFEYFLWDWRFQSEEAIQEWNDIDRKKRIEEQEKSEYENYLKLKEKFDK